MPKIAPFGTWKESKITADSVTAKTAALNGVKVSPANGGIYLWESRPNGSNTIYEISSEGNAKEIVPEDFNVRSTVHEYGGAAWTFTRSGKIVFANFDDQGVYLLDPDTKGVKRILHSPARRFADFNVHPLEENLILAIQEDHTHDEPSTVVNSLVLINSDTGNVKELVQGADFFTTPRFSPDGKGFAWLQWNHPEMPWTGASLFWSSFESSITSATPQWIAGSSDQCISEPRWGGDEYLYFLQEITNYRQPFKWKNGQQPQSIPLDGLQEVEFGGPEFFLGSSTYIPLSERALVAAYVDNGRSALVEIDPTKNTWKDLGLPFQSITFDALTRLSDTSFVAIGSTVFSPKALYRVDLAPQASLKKLRSSSEEDFDESVFSKPEHIYCLPANGDHEIGVHGFFFPPHNEAYRAPEGTKPPLIILSHGGPTAHHSPGLTLLSQYWTSRGFALFLLNYRGSSGHGRKYRESLNSNWGLFEPEDAVNAAEFLAKSGRIDRTRVGIQGGSAGGYCVCQAITIYPKAFAAAVSLYGIGDLSGLIKTTHKFEAGYPERLLFKPGQSQSERDAIVKDRSALTHVDKIETPLLMLHGREDKVVPLEQAELIRDAMEKREREVRLVIFDGESHGFRKPENLITALDEQMAWWRKTLVR